MKTRTKVCGALLLAGLGTASQLRINQEDFRLVKKNPNLSREMSRAANSMAPYVQSTKISFRKKPLLHYIKIRDPRTRETEYKLVDEEGTIDTTLGRLNIKTGEYK